MKRFLLYIAAISISLSTYAQSIESATEAVKNMGLGWNLGNTLDANGQQKTTDVNDAAYWGCQGLESETYWGQSATTKELFTMMKNAGFGAIRVPVTWYNHMDQSGKVNAAWMARVRQIVDWAMEAGLYCIVNVHHDTGADGANYKSWIKADMATYNAQKSRFEYLWKQIATEFKDYDEHLLFEAYNEMLDTKNSWCFASFNTTGQYDATIATSAYNAINSYAQSFVNTVRATGGNNAQRNLIINTYAAANGLGTWNSHLTDPLTKINIPKDDTTGHIIFEIHTYPNITETIASVKSDVDKNISILKQHLVSKGAPVIIGEWGTSNVDAGDGKTDYEVRRSQMFEFVDYFIKQMKASNMATFYWMGLTDGRYRAMPAFNQPDLAEKMAKAYHGSDFKGEYPEYTQPAEMVCFEGSKAINWGDGISIVSDFFKNAGSKCQLKLTFAKTASSGADLQFFYGNWSEKFSFIINGTTYNGDYGPGGTLNADQTVTITFPSATYEKLSRLGTVIHGTGVTIKKAVIVNPDAAAGIYVPHASSAASSPAFTLSGQRVGKEYKGIVIKNGRKYFQK